ncbi:MAG: hypothetical protein RSG77_17870 [Hafnia sp.]
MASTDILKEFSDLSSLRNDYESLGLEWRNGGVDTNREEIAGKLYVLHYKAWRHAAKLGKMVNNSVINEPVLNGRFEVEFPPLSQGHHKVAKHVIARYLNNRVGEISRKVPVGFEFTYDHPRSVVNILAERNNLKSMQIARALALDLVTYSSVVKCPLKFKNQTFRSAYPPRPLSVMCSDLVGWS